MVILLCMGISASYETPIFPFNFKLSNTKVKITIMLKMNKKQTWNDIEAHEMRHWDGISKIMFRSCMSTIFLIHIVYSYTALLPSLSGGSNLLLTCPTLIATLSLVVAKHE